MVPADDQAIVLPCASVIVIMVLLNEAATCATPDAMFFRSRRRTRVASLPILDPFAARQPQGGAGNSLLLAFGFLLAGDGLGRALAGPCVGVRALSANRQALAMAQAAVATKIHE